jgi:hypothetical protein
MYFIEMFADPSDRARFLAILLSAFFVGLGVWYTQRKITIRESKAFRVSKIEELYITSDECIHLIEALQEVEANEGKHLDSILAGMKSKKEGLPFSEVKDDLLKRHKHLTMLVNLYFPSYKYTKLYQSETQPELNYSINVSQAIVTVQVSDSSSAIPDISLTALLKESEHYIDLTIKLSIMNSK